MKIDPLVEEYVRGLNPDDLDVIYGHFVAGDRGAASEFVAKTPKVDGWLGSSKNPDEFFDRLDSIRNRVVERVEGRRR